MFSKVEFSCIVTECHLCGKESSVSCKDQTHRCEILQDRGVGLEKIHTFDSEADMLTKPVTIEKFKHYLDLINISRC